jgi:dTDP-4-dehydrorhamnose reductase
VNDQFESFRPDYCINCAAYTKVDQAELTPEPAFAINVTGVENLAKACLEFNTVLIHVSTDYVFDGTKTGGYYPEDQPNPINVYGNSKWEGEKLITGILSRYFIVRTSWLYSKKYPPNFYLTILNKAKKGENLTVTDSETGCPTDASDLGRYILEMVNSGRSDYGISHFAGKEVMTWYGFASVILREHLLSESINLVKGQNLRSFVKRPATSILLTSHTK